MPVITPSNLLYKPRTRSRNRRQNQAPNAGPNDPAIQHFADTGADGMRYTFAPGTVFIDAAGTQPAGELDPVGRVTDLSGNGYHMQQSSTAAKPILKKTAGGVWYLESDGTKWMECPQLITLTDQWSVCTSMQHFSYFNHGGVWRMLRDGGNADGDSDNRLEEYWTSNLKRTLWSRYQTAGGAGYQNDHNVPVSADVISWANRKSGVTPNVGLVTAGINSSEVRDLYYSIGTARLSLFRGYTGDIMEGRMYGFTFAVGGWPDATRQAINDYEAARLGIVA